MAQRPRLKSPLGFQVTKSIMCSDLNKEIFNEKMHCCNGIVKKNNTMEMMTYDYS